MKIEINLQLLKNSAKKSFIDLREKSPFLCVELGTKIIVSKRFFTHIAKHPKRSQSLKDLTERLLIIPFIDEILRTGKLITKRKKGLNQYFRISKKYKNEIYTVIVLKVRSTYFLLSCFIDFYKK